MRLRVVGSLLLLILAGCAASDGGLDHGGQTGSLLPPADCDLPAAESGALRIAEGDTAFVAYVPPGAMLAATLTDAAGAEVDVAFEPVADAGSAQAATTEDVLPAGNYTLHFDCASATQQRSIDIPLVVEPQAPVPVALGTITFVQGEVPTCEDNPFLHFTLQLSADAAQYRQLIELSLSVDGAPAFVVAHFGTLSTDALRVRRCDGSSVTDCVPSRLAELEFSARLAGSDARLEAVNLELDAACEPPPEDEAACIASLAPRPQPPDRAPLTAWLYMLATALGLRRLGCRTSAHSSSR